MTTPPDGAKISAEHRGLMNWQDSNWSPIGPWVGLGLGLVVLFSLAAAVYYWVESSAWGAAVTLEVLCGERDLDNGVVPLETDLSSRDLDVCASVKASLRRIETHEDEYGLQFYRVVLSDPVESGFIDLIGLYAERDSIMRIDGRLIGIASLDDATPQGVVLRIPYPGRPEDVEGYYRDMEVLRQRLFYW